MSHRPREDTQDSEGRSGQPIPRHERAKASVVAGLRIIKSEPDPKRRRRELTRKKIENALRNIADLDDERARRRVEGMFRTVCVAGEVPSEPEE